MQWQREETHVKSLPSKRETLWLQTGWGKNCQNLENNLWQKLGALSSPFWSIPRGFVLLGCEVCIEPVCDDSSTSLLGQHAVFHSVAVLENPFGEALEALRIAKSLLPPALAGHCWPFLEQRASELHRSLSTVDYSKWLV